MNPFNVYLNSLPKSPLVEAAKSVYESLTPADIQLGKYLKGFNNGVKVPYIPEENMQGNSKFYYMAMARNHKLVARILDIGTRLTEETKPAIINEISQLLRTVVNNQTKSSCEDIAKSMAEYMENADKAKLAECATLFNEGKSDLAYNMLATAFPWGYGGFCGLFANQVNKDADDDVKNMIMDPNPKKSLIRNHWLIHGTRVKSGLSIILNGFDRGNKIGDLAYNRSEPTDKDKPHDYSGDYLFAYDASDNVATFHDGNSIIPNSYGKFMLMFKASGYKIFHVGDYEHQVMFDYHEPKAFFFILDNKIAAQNDIPVGKKEYSLYGCYKDENGDDEYKIIVSNDDLSKVIAWVVQYGDRYEKLMFHV